MSPTKARTLVALFDLVGSTLPRPSKAMSEDSWTCNDGALFAAFICDLLGLRRRLSVGLYYHSGPEFLADLRDEDVDDVLEPFDEHHHWVMVADDDVASGEWLLDPNGEVRGEPRLQRSSGGIYWESPHSLRKWWANDRPDWIPRNARYVADDCLAMAYSPYDNPADMMSKRPDVWLPALLALRAGIDNSIPNLINEQANAKLDEMIESMSSPIAGHDLDM